jgi:hypothetical protein
MGQKLPYRASIVFLFLWPLSCFSSGYDFWQLTVPAGHQTAELYFHDPPQSEILPCSHVLARIQYDGVLRFWYPVGSLSDGTGVLEHRATGLRVRASVEAINCIERHCYERQRSEANAATELDRDAHHALTLRGRRAILENRKDRALIKAIEENRRAQPAFPSSRTQLVGHDAEVINRAARMDARELRVSHSPSAWVAIYEKWRITSLDRFLVLLDRGIDEDDARLIETLKLLPQWSGGFYHYNDDILNSRAGVLYPRHILTGGDTIKWWDKRIDKTRSESQDWIREFVMARANPGVFDACPECFPRVMEAERFYLSLRGGTWPGEWSSTIHPKSAIEVLFQGRVLSATDFHNILARSLVISSGDERDSQAEAYARLSVLDDRSRRVLGEAVQNRRLRGIPPLEELPGSILYLLFPFGD